jgi:hypothetical protein
MPSRAHKELVFQYVPQSAQRMAYRRLTEPEPVPRPRDAAFLHDRVKDGEQIEVKSTPVHRSVLTGSPSTDPSTIFDLCISS